MGGLGGYFRDGGYETGFQMDIEECFWMLVFSLIH